MVNSEIKVAVTREINTLEELFEIIKKGYYESVITFSENNEMTIDIFDHFH